MPRHHTTWDSVLKKQIDIPFTAAEETAHDTEEVAFLAEAPVRALASLRTKRNQLLAETDWRFMSDQTPTKEWIDYRQALRDLPNNTVDLENPIWPTPPTNL